MINSRRISRNYSRSYQSVQIFQVLLRMPSQCMTINCYTSSFCFVNEVGYRREIHDTFIIYYRGILHGITSCHFIKVGRNGFVHHSVLNEIVHRCRQSQLEIGIFGAVYIRFQHIVIIQIFVLSNAFRFLHRIRQYGIVHTRAHRQAQCQSRKQFHILFHVLFVLRLIIINNIKPLSFYLTVTHH